MTYLSWEISYLCFPVHFPVITLSLLPLLKSRALKCSLSPLLTFILEHFSTQLSISNAAQQATLVISPGVLFPAGGF